jgi:hypothetical protein
MIKGVQLSFYLFINLYVNTVSGHTSISDILIAQLCVSECSIVLVVVKCFVLVNKVWASGRNSR